MEKWCLVILEKLSCTNANIIELASKQLNLEPTTELAINIADKDESKSIAYTKTLLEKRV